MNARDAVLSEDGRDYQWQGSPVQQSPAVRSGPPAIVVRHPHQSIRASCLIRQWRDWPVRVTTPHSPTPRSSRSRLRNTDITEVLLRQRPSQLDGAVQGFAGAEITAVRCALVSRPPLGAHMHTGLRCPRERSKSGDAMKVAVVALHNVGAVTPTRPALLFTRRHGGGAHVAGGEAPPGYRAGTVGL